MFDTAAKAKTIVCACASFLIGVGTASAQGVDAFYRNTGLQIIVGFGPGGRYDIYARALARHIGRQLPGLPNVVVQNMPGAGSLKAANYIYNLAPKDGSQIAVFARGLAMQPLLDTQAFRSLADAYAGSDRRGLR